MELVSHYDNRDDEKSGADGRRYDERPHEGIVVYYREKREFCIEINIWFFISGSCF